MNEKFQYWYNIGRAFKKVYILLKGCGLWSKKMFESLKLLHGCPYTYCRALKFVRFSLSYEALFEYDPDDEEFKPFDLGAKAPSIIGLYEICDLNSICKEKISKLRLYDSYYCSCYCYYYYYCYYGYCYYYYGYYFYYYYYGYCYYS